MSPYPQKIITRIRCNCYFLNVISIFQTPRHGRLVKTYAEFLELSKKLTHFAIKRSLGYWHHFLATGISEKKKYVEYYMSFVNFFLGPGEVGKRELSEESFEKAIENKELFIIDKPGYPRNSEEIEKAKDRINASSRLKERKYTVYSSNCEHFVNYIMTGRPNSDQVRDAAKSKVFLIDTIDVLVCYGKRTLSKSSGWAITTPIGYLATKSAGKEIVQAAAAPVHSSVKPAVLNVDICTKNMVTHACKNTKFTPTDVLQSPHGVEVAKTVTRKTFLRSTATSLAVTGVIEAAGLGFDIYQLKKKLNNKRIRERDFKREVTKSVGGATCATVLTIAGGILGQAICPIPFVGSAVGSWVGNYFGRWIGNTIFGQAFDYFF